jgi:hypothetical protein
MQVNMSTHRHGMYKINIFPLMYTLASVREVVEIQFM